MAVPRPTTTNRRMHPDLIAEIALMSDDQMAAFHTLLIQRAKAKEERVYHGEAMRYRRDPAAYCREKLHKNLTPDQARMFQSVMDNRYTLVKASHAVGKTYWAAMLVNWWYDCWDQHIAYITAPTWPQALGLTFKQAAKMRRENGLPGKIVDGLGMVRDHDPISAVGHFFKALNAESGEGFQGEHTSDILVVLEEGVGVPVYIWQAMRGLMTSAGCRAVTVGNPTNEATPFGEAASQEMWDVMSISALDHPNVLAELRGEPQPFPKATGLLWLYEMLDTECEVAQGGEDDAFLYWKKPVIKSILNGTYQLDDADGGAVRPDDPRVCWYVPTSIFQSRVLGDFPSVPDKQVIPSGWMRNLPVIPTESLYGYMPEIGCDVARFGTDRTAIMSVWGGAALAGYVIRRMDNVAVTDRLRFAAVATSLTTGVSPKAIPLKIDVTGSSGAGPHDALKAQGYNCYGVNSSTRAYNEKLYHNRRTELWFIAREGFRLKEVDLSRLQPDIYRQLVKELAIPMWKPDNAGRREVEKKEDISKRLGYSPDLADAYNLARTGPLMLGGQLRAVGAALRVPETPIERIEAERRAMEAEAVRKLPKDLSEQIMSILGQG